jgi:hypothetical protein
LRWKDLEGVYDKLEKVTEKETLRDVDDLMEAINWKSKAHCSEKLSRFLNWLASHKVDTRFLAFQTNPEQTGLTLFMKLGAGVEDQQVIFAIPPDAFMSEEAASKALSKNNQP